MTENEAIQVLTSKHTSIGTSKCDDVEWRKLQPAIDEAVKSLEEIQKYRSIETELREHYHANVDIKILMKYFIETIFKGENHEGFCVLTNEDAKMWEEYQEIGTVEEIKRMQRYSTLAKKHSTIGQVIDSCAEYEAIGTVEECRKGREKQIANKPIRVDVGHNGSSTDGCPVCKREFYEKFNFCPDCGTMLDWNE